jgi:polysaccharide export outer membrane protein
MIRTHGSSVAISFARVVVSAMICTWLVMSLGCATASPYDYRREPDPRSSEYLIGPLDEMSILVWRNQELSVDVVVRPDGIITVPLVGAVKAAGRTPSDLQAELAKRFADYVRAGSAAVTVSVTSVNSYLFTVSGNVEHPGVLSSKTYVTAVDAVAMAGGLNRFASDAVWVIRGAPSRRIPVDLRRAVSGEHPEENLVLIRGDLIVVP